MLNVVVPSKDGDLVVTEVGLGVADTLKLLLLDRQVRLVSTRPQDLVAVFVEVSAADSPVEAVSEMAPLDVEEALDKEEEESGIRVEADSVVVTAVSPTASLVVPKHHHQMLLLVPAGTDLLVAVVATALVGMADRARTAAARLLHMAITLPMVPDRILVGITIREEVAHMMKTDLHTAEVDHIRMAAIAEREAVVAAIVSR